MAISLSIPKGRTTWRGNLKGLSHERGWVKSEKKFGASPFKTYRMTLLSAKSISLDSPFNSSTARKKKLSLYGKFEDISSTVHN